ncbi:Serpentine receptor class gamma-11, partial [Frankliniella fusca]
MVAYKGPIEKLAAIELALFLGVAHLKRGFIVSKINLFIFDFYDGIIFVHEVKSKEIFFDVCLIDWVIIVLTIDGPSRGSSASATSSLAAAASSAPAASAACLCVGVRVGCSSYCIEGGDESCESLIIGLIPIYHVLRCGRDILVANFCCLERPHFLVWGLQGELEIKPTLQLMHGAIQGGWCGVGAAIERWDFHLLLYKANMGPFVLLRRKSLPVPGHLIAGTPLK